MCTLHLFYKVFPEAPVCFVGNRDEHLDRRWQPPELLLEAPRAWGPRDLGAGGTWLGTNEFGVVVALANHHGTLGSGHSLCSRGTVVLETLRHTSADEARAFAEWVSPACKAYTLLIADAVHAFVVDHSPTGTQTYRLLPGCHVVTNERFRQPGDAKAQRCRTRMEARAGGPLPSPAAWFEFLADHEAAAPDCTPLCVHPTAPDRFGTSSASVIQVDAARGASHFFFAPGPPCSTPYQQVPLSRLRPAAPAPAATAVLRRG